MSKKMIATLSLSLLTLAACSTPADVVNDDTVLEEDMPVLEEISIEDLLLEEEMIGEEIVEEAVVEEEIMEEEAAPEAEVEAEIVE